MEKNEQVIAGLFKFVDGNFIAVGERLPDGSGILKECPNSAISFKEIADNGHAQELLSNYPCGGLYD